MINSRNKGLLNEYSLFNKSQLHRLIGREKMNKSRESLID